MLSKWVFLAGLLPGWAMGQVAGPITTGSAGQWKGPLSTPGGSIPIEFTITQSGVDKLAATLDLPAKRLNRVPVAATLRGDTLVLFAATVECRFVCVSGADGQELRGIWSQPGLRVPLTLRRFSENAAAQSSTISRVLAAPTTFHTEPVTLSSQPGNVQLAGTLSIPDGPGPYPAAVLLADMGSHNREARPSDYRMLADMATALARQGVAVLRLDDRGVGQSAGNATLATTADLVRDAQAGLGYLRTRPSVDPLRAGLIGHGEGGNVALLAAAQPMPPSFVVTLAASGLIGQDLLASQGEPTDTARIGAARRLAWTEVLSKAAKLRASGSNSAQVGTYLSQQRLKVKTDERKLSEATLKFRWSMLEIVRQTANDDQAQAIVLNMLRQRYPELDPAVARTRAAQLITPWSRYYLKFDPQTSLAAVNCTVLLVNGADDEEVNSATNLAALEKGLRANKRVTVRRLPGINHSLQAPPAELAAAPAASAPIVAPVVLNTVRDWVLQQAGK